MAGTLIWMPGARGRLTLDHLVPSVVHFFLPSLSPVKLSALQQCTFHPKTPVCLAAIFL